MKAIRIFIRNIGNAIKSITRNFSLSAASILCTAITLFIVSIAIICSSIAVKYTDDLKETMTILVYVDKDATEEQINTIETEIKSIKNVKSDALVKKSKEEIKNETIESMCQKEETDSPYCKLMKTWSEETNPLMTEFIVHINNIEEMEETASSIEKIENINNVKYSKDILEKMRPVFKMVEKIALVIIIGLILVTTFLICNTIRITIVARKSEIEIMRLVGTSNFVIKLPFVIEGLFLGMIGALVPIIATIWGYTILFDYVKDGALIKTLELLQPFPFTLYVSGVLLVIGAIVGMFGSYITVRKFLKI